MRKSSPSSKEIAGNSEKYESYREAWSRIQSALENHFYLEAITIEESIISDRLISTFSGSKSLKPLPELKTGRSHSFYQLIEHWRSAFSGGLQSGEYSNLIEAVDQWRCMRNRAIHAIVKSAPGEPHPSIDGFLLIAKEAAEKGEKLAREVSKWNKQSK